MVTFVTYFILSSDFKQKIGNWSSRRTATEALLYFHSVLYTQHTLEYTCFPDNIPETTCKPNSKTCKWKFYLNMHEENRYPSAPNFFDTNENFWDPFLLTHSNSSEETSEKLRLETEVRLDSKTAIWSHPDFQTHCLWLTQKSSLLRRLSSFLHFKWETSKKGGSGRISHSLRLWDFV